MEKAQREVARLEGAMGETPGAKKRQRIERSADEYWHEWEPHMWRSLEMQSYVRRARLLSADAPARAPDKLPRGARDGFLHHPRRGLVGALRDWAEGSTADAAKMVFSLIEELELEVRRRSVCPAVQCACSISISCYTCMLHVACCMLDATSDCA